MQLLQIRLTQRFILGNSQYRTLCRSEVSLIRLSIVQVGLKI